MALAGHNKVCLHLSTHHLLAASPVCMPLLLVLTDAEDVQAVTVHTRLGYWPLVILPSIRVGFSGALSTVSTFVAEVCMSSAPSSAQAVFRPNKIERQQARTRPQQIALCVAGKAIAKHRLRSHLAVRQCHMKRRAGLL